MKKSVLICVIYLLLLPIGSKGQVFVRGHIHNLKYDSIIFMYEENYIALEKRQQKVPIIKNSYSTTLPIYLVGKASLIYVGSDKNENVITFFAQPKDSVLLSFDAKTPTNSISFGGTNALYNNNFYANEQRKKQTAMIEIKQRNPEKYLKYIDSLSSKEVKFFETLVENTVKKNKKLQPNVATMSQFYCWKTYSKSIAKMKYPEQKVLLQTIELPPLYYAFLKEHGCQHNVCISNEDYRNFLEIYLLFLYQQKYGTSTVATIKDYQQLYEMIPTAFKGSLTRNFLQARVVAKIARDFPAQVQEFYTKYLQQNPTSIFNKDLASIVQPNLSK